MKKLDIYLAVVLVSAVLIIADYGDLWGVRFIDKNQPVEKQELTQAIPPGGGVSSPARPSEKNKYVTMDFDGVDIKVFIKFIADVTGRNFIVGDDVRGKVTVISPRKITVGEAYKVFESVLEVNGYTTIPMGAITKIVKSSEARTKSVETRQGKPVGTEDRVVTQIVPLKYADASDMRSLLSPLMSKRNSLLLAYPQSNILIITDTLSNIKRLTEILKVIDIPGSTEDIQIIPLTYASAAKLGDKLTQILAEQTKRVIRRRVITPGTLNSKAQIKVIPDERTNSIIVVAPAQEMKRILALVHKLDIPTPSGKEDIHVYYLQYANAEDLAKVLTEVPTPGTTKSAGSTAGARGSTASSEVKISADKDTNSLIIYAESQAYTKIVDTIKHLDIPRKQVYVKGLIMEVKTSSDFKVGVEWTGFEDFTYDNGDRKGGIVARTGESFISTPADIPSGPILGVIGQAITINQGGTEITFPNMTSFINAMRRDTDVNIISTPQIITMDNKEAEIKVGENVPYVTREQTDTSNISNVVRTYDYRDVGVTLKITPQISQRGNIRMDLFQEITTLVPGQGVKEYAPTTLKRSASTTVTIKNGTTMVIGGLIGQELTYTNYKVPLLGDIPVLGHLFKSTSKEKERTNLYIFLTPEIIDTEAKANELYRQKYGEIKDIRDRFEKKNNRKAK